MNFYTFTLVITMPSNESEPKGTVTSFSLLPKKKRGAFSMFFVNQALGRRLPHKRSNSRFLFFLQV